MAWNIRDATQFLESIDLSGTPRRVVQMDASTEANTVFDDAKKQAQVVGSGLFSFTEGVTAEVRTAISNSALLAQLVANKRASADENPRAWFNAYFDVLQNIGWTVQDRGWTDYTTSGTAVEVNEKIVEVLRVALGDAPAALKIIEASLSALKAMQPESSWLTIFNQESAKAKFGRIQVGLVDKAENGDLFVYLIACLIEAKNTITQILFFKFREAEAKFAANSSKVSINQASLTELSPEIIKKTRIYQNDYLSSIQNLEL